MCVQRSYAYIMIHQGPLVTLLALRNITRESMVRRSGSVRNALRDMLSNQIGKLTRKCVGPVNIDVIVEPCSQGWFGFLG